MALTLVSGHQCVLIKWIDSFLFCFRMSVLKSKEKLFLIFSSFLCWFCALLPIPTLLFSLHTHICFACVYQCLQFLTYYWFYGSQFLGKQKLSIFFLPPMTFHLFVLSFLLLPFPPTLSSYKILSLTPSFAINPLTSISLPSNCLEDFKVVIK